MEKRLRVIGGAIEDLPDEILANILSRLSVRDAGRTSVVIRSWRNLWRFCTSLDMDFKSSVEDDTGKRAAKCMDYVLEMYQGGPRLDAMRIALNYNIHAADNFVYTRLIGWLRFANEKQVKSLCVDLNNTSTAHVKDKLLFPISWPDKVNRHWERLTTISLKSISISSEQLQRLVSTSPNLVTLSVENAPYLETANVHSVILKHLEILYCKKITTIHIVFAPNLVSLKNHPHQPKYYHRDSPTASLRLDHAPKLSAISLSGPICAAIIMQLPHFVLHELQLDMDQICIFYNHLLCWDYLKAKAFQFPTFPNLKQLQVRYTHNGRDHPLRNLVSITSVCPTLSHLTLNYQFDPLLNIDFDDDDDVEDHTSTTNQFLRVIQFLGWSGLKFQVRLARYLIRTCPNLESITFDPMPPHPMEKDDHQWESAVLAAQKLIQNSEFPSTAQSVIVCRGN